MSFMKKLRPVVFEQYSKKLIYKHIYRACGSRHRCDNVHLLFVRSSVYVFAPLNANYAQPYTGSSYASSLYAFMFFRNVDRGSARTCLLHQEVVFWVPFATTQVSLNSYREAIRSKYTFNIEFAQTCTNSSCRAIHACSHPSTRQFVRNISNIPTLI